MSETNRIKIVVYNDELDYKSAEDLGISFNRIADNEADMSKKYGEFSYSFELPFTKNNANIFQYAAALGVKNIFKPNRDLPCKVFNNDQLLLDGVISLQAITATGYECVFYSKLKEFADLIEDKNLRDLKFPTITWNYESTIINHINADYQSSDDTYWQFPLTYYGTYFTPYNTFRLKKDYKNVTFDIEAYPHQQYYYCMNYPSTNTPNRFYHHQIPPAFYIVSVINRIFQDADWTVGGQFFNDPNIKKIVMLYAGDDDLYDKAVVASDADYDEAGGIISTSGLTTPLYPGRLLPDMSQADFLNGIINMFALYPIVDVQNKTIKFETYTTIYGDNFNPYDITSKILKDSAKFVYMENNDPSIKFDAAENFRIMGDNCTSTGSTTNATSMFWKATTDVNMNDFFNRNGTTETIEIPFSPPTIKKTYLWNDYNKAGTLMNAGTHVIFQPIMSSQTQYDSKKFAGNTGQTYIYNNEGFIKFGGSPSLHYYYGKSDNDFVNKTSKGSASNYYFINIYTGGTINRVPITFCSPFQLSTYRDDIDSYSSNPDDMNSLKTIATTYLRSTWNLLGKTVPSTVTKTTDFSLVFDSQGYFHDTLWSVFHKPKYDRFQKSEVLEADMRMTAYDWQEMQIFRPILYNNEIYHIIEIVEYNPITYTASIRLIKTL